MNRSTNVSMSAVGGSLIPIGHVSSDSPAGDTADGVVRDRFEVAALANHAFKPREVGFDHLGVDLLRE